MFRAAARAAFRAPTRGVPARAFNSVIASALQSKVACGAGSVQRAVSVPTASLVTVTSNMLFGADPSGFTGPSLGTRPSAVSSPISNVLGSTTPMFDIFAFADGTFEPTLTSLTYPQRMTMAHDLLRLASNSHSRFSQSNSAAVLDDDGG
jgi:hypothetical protein